MRVGIKWRTTTGHQTGPPGGASVTALGVTSAFSAAVKGKPGERRGPEGEGRLAWFPGDAIVLRAASPAFFLFSFLPRERGRHALVTLSN